MLRFTETEDMIVAFFNNTEVRDDLQIANAGSGVYELLGLASSAGKRLTLSFHGVQFLSSAIFGAIVLVNNAAKHRRVTFRLANVEPGIMDTFRAVRLHKVLRFEHMDNAQDLLEASIPVPLNRKETAPCPVCGAPLATKLAKQCLECGADWH